MVTLIAEDLLVLLVDDESGLLGGSGYLRPALGGAVLAELAQLGAVTVDEPSSAFRSTRVHAVAGQRPADPVLASAYDVVDEKVRSASNLVGRVGKGLSGRLTDRLVEAGVVERRDTRRLARRRWRVRETWRRRELQTALDAALLQGVPPDERTAALIGILHSMGRAHRMVDHHGISVGQVKKRAKRIADGQWAAKAVRDAISASASGAA